MTHATTFRAAAVVGGFLIAILLVMTASRAAFTDPTSNDANLVGAGSVYLDNNAPNNTDPGASGPGDGSGDEMFGAATGAFTVKADNLAPGDSVTNCINVIYVGSLAASVDLDSLTVGTDTDGLADNVGLSIERFESVDCTGAPEVTLTGVSDTLSAFTLTEAAWTPTGLVVVDKSYQVTLTLIDDAFLLSSDQGGQVGAIDFEWLATST